MSNVIPFPPVFKSKLPVIHNDPRQLGARCDDCALGGRREEVGLKLGDWCPVPSELRDTQSLTVAEAPGGDEERDGRPLIGPSGEELMGTFALYGLDRRASSYANVIGCRPPNNELDRLKRKISVRNREIKSSLRKQGLKGQRLEDAFEQQKLRDPEELCRPRLMKEAVRYANLILLGGTALRAFASGSILEMQGGPLFVGLADDGWTTLMLDEGESWPKLRHVWRALPLLHPAHVLRMKRHRAQFAIGLGRAFRFFNNALQWKKPTVIRERITAEMIRALHRSKIGSFVVIDMESNWHPPPPKSLYDDDGNPKPPKPGDKNHCRLVGDCRNGCVRQSFLEQKIRCIGIGDSDMAYVVHLLSVDGETEPYPEHEKRELLNAFRDLWLDDRVLKVGHNFDWAEILILARPEYLGVEPANYRCSLLDAQLVDSELPLDLQTRVLLYEDAPSWKAKGTRENPRSDEELGLYNGTDVVANARMAPKQWRIVQDRRQEQLVYYGHLVGMMCRNMHRMGLRVDQPRRERWETQLNTEIEKWTARARALSGVPDLNPNSPPQMAKLFFDDWDMMPLHVSPKTGEPSTDDETLIHLYGQLEKGDPRREVVRAVRFVRKPIKMRGTFVRPCRPRYMEGGWTWEDGRLHVDWKKHGAKSGRISSSDPVSLQTYPGKPPYNLRSMFIPDPGHCFVSCDLDQIELRVVVALSGARNYIEALNNGYDPHGLMAERAFKHRYTNAPGYVDPRTGKKPKKGSIPDRLRDLVKRVVYGALYGANVPTLHAQIVSAEDDHGELIYADADIAETKLVYEEWLKFAPEIKAWWASTLDFWKLHGYVVEPVLGRRRDCADSRGYRDTGDEFEIEINEIYNHPIQSTAAALMALILEKIVARYPWGFAGRNTGIVLQTHDSYMLEVPFAIAEEVKAFLTDAMTMVHSALPGIRVTAEADISMRYGQEYCTYCEGDVDREMAQWINPKTKQPFKVCTCELPVAA